MAGSAKATIDHEEIKKWVQERGGCPARVKRTGDDDDPGILRIDFPGYSGVMSLEKISWDEFFEWFDKNELAFLHQDTTASGKTSRFSKVVSREHVDVEPHQKQARTEQKGERKETSKAQVSEQRQVGHAEAQKQIGESDSAEPVSELEEVALETSAEAREPADLLERQHDLARDLFVQLEGGDLSVAPDLLNTVALHLELEEVIVYPMLLDTELDETIRESIVEHVGVKRLIRDLIDAPVADDAWWAMFRVLHRYVEEHMEREEEDVLPVLRSNLTEEQKLALKQEMDAFTVEQLEIGENAPLESALSNTDARLEQ